MRHTPTRILIAVQLCLMLCTTARGQHSSDAADDVLQHVPMATVIALKACGAPAASASWGELLLSGGASYAIAAATTYSLKHIVNEQRPDKSDRRSMPSGHATMAFAGATMLHHEYGRLSPWVSIAGYGVATLTAAHRVVQDRHYLHDVCAGAAIGVAATELTYYLKKRLFPRRDVSIAFTGQNFCLAVTF